MVKNTQFTFGLTTQIGKNIFVVAVNAAMIVTIPEGYEIKIAANLKNEGVKELSGQRVKFPAKGSFAAAVVLDDEFMEAKVRSLSAEIIVATATQVQSSFDQERFDAVLGQIADKIDEDGEIAKLFTLFDKKDTEMFEKATQHFAQKLSTLKWDKLGEEVGSLIKQYQHLIKTPEIETTTA